MLHQDSELALIGSPWPAIGSRNGSERWAVSNFPQWFSLTCIPQERPKMAEFDQGRDGEWGLLLANQRVGLISLQKDIGSFKFGLFTGNGAAVGWNAATGHLYDEGESGSGSCVLSFSLS